MSAITAYGAAQMLACGMGGATPPATFYIALFSGSADPGGSPSELTVSGYSRAGVTFVPASTASVANAVDAFFQSLGAGNYEGVGIFDDPTAGNLWAWGDESGSVAIPAGSDVTFPAGQLTVAVPSH